MPKDMMNTKEVAEYLGIHEKQVYSLIKSGRIPCTRITGKWIFPKHIIDEWITSHAQHGTTGTEGKTKTPEGYIMSAGSNDPILDILLSYMKQSHPGFYIFTCSIGSTKGLCMLGERKIDVAWCHLLDPKTGDYNIPYLADYIQDMKVAVVHLFYRELGFILSPQAKLNVTEFSDLTAKGVEFVNRQEGSGTRVLLDYHLQRTDIDPHLINGYERVVHTHFEVGLAVLSGEANIGIATVAISNLFGLPFVPLVRESFDMVLSQETFFLKGLQAFIDTLKTEEFRKIVKPLGNYDFSESGKIIHSVS
ncbi:MAG: helix-turn-helix transcriptional regulator [Spirochaetota bacterium]|nr:helix-turn-helix transcriptional regulator [Spirochaetota bacterium]